MSIVVENLTKQYGTQKAINDISFRVNTGEILGFLGPNGAGKTTTMKIITCFMAPSAGDVKINDVSIHSDQEKIKKNIGYLPENNPLYHEMPVLEYLEFVARLQGVPKDKIEKRILEMVLVCGLNAEKHKKIGELSKGYRQRVGLAQAMIHDPEVLILDEPTSGLDPNQIVEIRNLIRKLGRAKTVVLSTHILSEVQATCDRVIIINEGAIVADGTPNELQRSFHGSEAVSLELKVKSSNPMDDLFPKLKAIQNVESVEFRGSDGDAHKFLIQSVKESDIREDLFRKAVAEQ